MKLLITLLLLLCHNCVRSLPIQSQALENVDDQFFWQQAWFSSNDKPDSPFTSGDSKKITAKSIFITPNLVKPSHYCPPGYLIDDNGKCIKVFAIQQPSEELLTSRLINLISTDNFEYDYDDGEQSTSSEQLNNLPALVPILNENSGEDEKSEIVSTSEKISFFLGDDKKDDLEIVITTLSNDNETVSYEHATVGGEDENVTEENNLLRSSEKSAESPTEILFESSTKASESSTENSLKASSSSSESSSEESGQKIISEEGSSPKNSFEVTTKLSIQNSPQINSEENQKEITESSSLKSANENSQENLNLSQNKTEIFESSSTTQKAHSESYEGSYESSAMTLEKILYGQFEKFLRESNLESSTQTAESQNLREALENSNKSQSTESSEEFSEYLNPQMIEKISNTESSSKAHSEKSTENPFKSTEPLVITTASNFKVEIFEQSTDVAISESSDKINLEADNAFLLNESLIIVDDKNNSSDVDYSDAITTLEPLVDFETLKEEEENSSTTQDDLEYDRKNENHLTTTTMATTTEFAKKLLRFPSLDDEQQRHRVRFPDDDEKIITTPRQTSFSWPRESNTQSSAGVPNKLHITRFWNSQPFISDNNSRGNSKNYRMENFLPYTRKVQILTPPRYNYQK